MSIEKIVSDIDEEIGRLKEAKRLLSDDESGKRGPGRPRKSTATSASKKRRKMSVAARAKIAAAQRARWAKAKKEVAKPAAQKANNAK